MVLIREVCIALTPRCQRIRQLVNWRTNCSKLYTPTIYFVLPKHLNELINERF